MSTNSGSNPNPNPEPIKVDTILKRGGSLRKNINHNKTRKNTMHKLTVNNISQ